MKLLELFQQLRTDLLFLLMTFDPKTEEARASSAALGRHCVLHYREVLQVSNQLNLPSAAPVDTRLTV